MTRSLILPGATLALAAAAATSSALPGSLTSDRNAARASLAKAESLLVSAAWVAAHLKDPNVVVIHVDHGDSAYAAGHIPGARFLDYMGIIDRGTELPPVDSLRRLLEAAGVSNNSRVVLYGPDVLMTARAFFTLDYLGHENVSIMDGGMGAWRRAGNPLTKDAPPARRGSFTPRVRTILLADAAWVQARLGKSLVAGELVVFRGTASRL